MGTHESLWQDTLGTGTKNKKGSCVLLLWMIIIFLPWESHIMFLHAACLLQRGPESLQKSVKAPWSPLYMSVDSQDILTVARRETICPKPEFQRQDDNLITPRESESQKLPEGDYA